MKEIKCPNCGSGCIEKKNGFKQCCYCRSKFEVDNYFERTEEIRSVAYNSIQCVTGAYPWPASNVFVSGLCE